MKELTLKIVEWAEERNFFGKDGAKIDKQFLKLEEEYGEMINNYNKGRDLTDDIGDQFVVLVILCVLSCGRDSVLDLLKDLSPFEYTKKSVFYLSVIRGRMAEKIIFILGLDYCNGFRLSDFKEYLRCLVAISKTNNLDFKKCVEVAYNDIKDRKGQWVNGVFVKQSDLKK